jgi:hypothetical protein
MQNAKTLTLTSRNDILITELITGSEENEKQNYL